MASEAGGAHADTFSPQRTSFTANFFCILLPEHLGTTICEGNIASVIKSSGSGTFTATSLIMHLEIDQSEEYSNNVDQLEEYVNCIDQSEESINSIDQSEVCVYVSDYAPGEKGNYCGLVSRLQ